jgi:hypothetical protein
MKGMGQHRIFLGVWTVLSICGSLLLSSPRVRGYTGGLGASFLLDIYTAPVQENGMKLTILKEVGVGLTLKYD